MTIDLTVEDVDRLYKTLRLYREQIKLLLDPVAKEQYDFLSRMLDKLEAAEESS